MAEHQEERNVITRVLLMFEGKSPSSGSLEGSDNSASCAHRTSPKPPWTLAYTIETFPFLILKLGPKFHRVTSH